MVRKPMQVVVETLIEKHGKVDEFNAAIEARDSFLLKLHNPPYMPLSIEVTPDGNIAVAHTFTQNGDLMYDPELVFDAHDWHVVEVTMHPTGVYQRVPDGMYSPSLEDFVRLWAKNLQEQGFLEL